MNQMNTARNGKSNNAAQDDEQQITTLRWWNQKEKPRSMWKSLI